MAFATLALISRLNAYDDSIVSSKRVMFLISLSISHNNPRLKKETDK
jgi:hypothetical protein